jgi:TonB-dependent SusC/RagA subfamily outer membrane receptor
MTDLIEKNYTTYSLDNMGGLVGGWAGNSIWGMDEYLVLVDGVPRDANNVMPTEIEQITFLKSAASVVLYGSRAAKGVVYITTKRGKAQPLKVNVRANTGFHVSKRYPKYLGSAEYMTLYNEARINDGLAAQYSDEDIYNFASGSNPYRYPDVDFYSSDHLKKAYNRTDVTAELTGGNAQSRFYTNIGYQRQGDVFNFGEAKNNYSDRLNIRGFIIHAVRMSRIVIQIVIQTWIIIGHMQPPCVLTASHHWFH